MTQPYATPADVAAAQGGPQQVETLLGHAYQHLLGKVPDLDTRVSSGRVSRERVKVVLVEMVQAVLRNPKALTGRATGPFSERFNMAAASGLLAVTDEHLEMLGAEGSGAYTVGPADHGLPGPRVRHRHTETEWW